MEESIGNTSNVLHGMRPDVLHGIVERIAWDCRTYCMGLPDVLHGIWEERLLCCTPTRR